MDFVKDIKTEAIIICSNYVKDKIIGMNLLKPIKFMTLNEFMKLFYFSYDEEAILYVMKKYNIKYEIALEYINNLYYVGDLIYGNSKLDFLVELKKKLDNNNLLIYNNYFKEYVKKVKIFIYDMMLDDFSLKMFDGLNYEIINPKYNNYKHSAIMFNTMEEEVLYVANEIAKLIDNGIDINNIKLTNVGKDYYNTISRIFSLYNIPINMPYESLLTSYDMVLEFINRYKNNEDISSILSSFNSESKIYQELIKVINKYLKYGNKELLIHKLENSYLKSVSYDNAVDIVDYIDYINSDDDYLFMLSFNEGSIPKNYMDTNYITDNICNLVGLKTSREKNIQLKKTILDKINNIKNLTITYKCSDNSKEYHPSILCDNFQVINGEIPINLTYSQEYDEIRLVKLIDDYMKYGANTKELGILSSNYKIKYNSYDNKFTGLDRKVDKLYLSYSKMNMYNKCAFRYYLANVLKLDIFEENFSALIGSMVHYIMEKSFCNNIFDTDKYVKEFLGDRVLNKKELFFLDKYILATNELIKQVMLERDCSKLDQAMYEKKIDINIDDKVNFVGIIDKILYHEENGKTYVSLIDYKTGNEDISLNYLKYGLNMQLPIYLYLASKLDFKNIVYAGFYLQKFNISKNDYRLEGYSNSDKTVLEFMDNGYDNSKIIKGLKTNKDGSFSRYSKVLDNEEINNIIDISDKQIRECANKIIKNEFTINPKVIDDKCIGCDFCKFKDICYKTKSDEVLITADEF